MEKLHSKLLIRRSSVRVAHNPPRTPKATFHNVAFFIAVYHHGNTYPCTLADASSKRMTVIAYLRFYSHLNTRYRTTICSHEALTNIKRLTIRSHTVHRDLTVSSRQYPQSRTELDPHGKTLLLWIHCIPHPPRQPVAHGHQRPVFHDRAESVTVALHSSPPDGSRYCHILFRHQHSHRHLHCTLSALQSPSDTVPCQTSPDPAAVHRQRDQLLHVRIRHLHRLWHDQKRF